MTNNDIIKALECCVKNNAVCDNECPLFGDGKHLKKDCKLSLLKASLSLINRQKSKIEKLLQELDISKAFYKETQAELKLLRYKYSKAKSEAIKEFAEQLQGISHKIDDDTLLVDVEDINLLVKEMTEG